MNSKIPGALNGRPRIGFGVIPRFVFAGLLSTAYWLIALNKFELHRGGNHIVTVLVGGMCLGLFLVTALWFYERLGSWRSAILLVTIMAVANCSFLFDRYVPPSFHEDQELPLLGFTRPDHLLFFFPTCLIAFIGFALVLLRRRNASRTVPIATAFAVVATLTFAYQVQSMSGSWVNPLPPDGLGILWQMTLVIFLGLSLWVEQITTPKTDSSTPQPAPAARGFFARNGFISLGILAGCFIAVQIWTTTLIRQERKRDAEHRAQVKIALAQALAEAPSRESLPPLQQEPLAAVFLQEVAGCTGCTINGPRSTMLPAEDVLPATETATPRALRPLRYSYSATYADSAGTDLPVEITAYPTGDWARYSVTHDPTLILYPDHVWKVSKFGNSLYQAGQRFYWASGNKVISVNWILARQPAMDAFLRAYLEKYPSSL